MLNKTGLANRVKKSKTRNVRALNAKTLFSVEGTRKRYIVRFDRNRAICKDQHGSYCDGNTRSVCYHVFAALVQRAKDGDVRIAFCANREDARRLSRLGGHVHRVENGLQRAEVFVVVFEDKTESEINEIQRRVIEGTLNDLRIAISAQMHKVEENPWSMRAKKSLDYLRGSIEELEGQL